MSTHVIDKRPRAVLYARVGANGARQPLEVLQETAHQRGWEVARVLTDPSVATGRDRRPELHRLMQCVRRGSVDVVAVARLSDFARSKRHLVAALDELRVRGVDFFAGQDAIDTTCSCDADWPRAVRRLARARKRQNELADKARLRAPRSAELDDAARLRALSRYTTLRRRDGSVVFPGLVFGPLVRASNPEELSRETNRMLVEASLEQEPS